LFEAPIPIAAISLCQYDDWSSIHNDVRTDLADSSPAQMLTLVRFGFVLADGRGSAGVRMSLIHTMYQRVSGVLGCGELPDAFKTDAAVGAGDNGDTVCRCHSGRRPLVNHSRVLLAGR
jgi:hypothetical protein